MATGEQSGRLFPEPPAGLGSPAYEHDRLSFTFPEIARQLRAHVERPAGILTGAQRRIGKNVILSLSKDLSHPWAEAARSACRGAAPTLLRPQKVRGPSTSSG